MQMIDISIQTFQAFCLIKRQGEGALSDKSMGPNVRICESLKDLLP
jgi:hypothetical protein